MDRLISQFSAIDRTGIPDPKTLPDDRSRIFAVLAIAAKVPEFARLTPHETSTILREVFHLNVSWQRVQSVLNSERRTVARTKKGGRRRFQLMAEGRDEITRGNGNVSVIRPESAFSDVMAIESILADLNGDVLICDPYIDPSTLLVIAECVCATSIKLLAQNLYNDSKFKRDLGLFNSEHDNKLDVRLASSEGLHDRYIVHDNGMLLLGTSLNGLGKKHSFISEVGLDIREATKTRFMLIWNRSKKP
jgi:hypothetical protein